MDFDHYLASKRKYKARVDIPNPAADEMVELLQKHLKTLASWLNGNMNRNAMLEAMRFFRRYFPGQYEATPGRIVYRGVDRSPRFDGEPRSYSYDRDAAEYFACSILSWNGFVIRRKVCDSCADKGAFRLSLDVAKVLKSYANHHYRDEREVIILNTAPKGSTAELLEVAC